MNIFKRTFNSISETRNKIKESFSTIFSFSNLTQKDIHEIEECLLSSDISWALTEQIIDEIKNNKEKFTSWQELLVSSINKSINFNDNYPELKKIIIIVGINGSGKTTTAAKLAKYFVDNNKNVTLVAADTYRAAAIEQLKIWAERINIDFISNSKTSDPASISFDGANSGLNKKQDHIIIDTAGRLHTSKNLMLELEKVFRVVGKLSDEISVCMTLDANVGQNGIKQVQEFGKYLPISNIILNKMDGTAKGGIALSIIKSLSIPISFLGIGEKYDDLIPFNFKKYIESLID